MASGKARPDMRTKAQVTVRMTDQFAKDLNLIMMHYKLNNASHVVQQSVAAQADALRARLEGDMHALATAIQEDENA